MMRPSFLKDPEGVWRAGGSYLYPYLFLMAQIWIVRLRLGNSIQGPRNQDHDRRIFYSG